MNFQSKIVQESEFGTWPSHGAGVPRGDDGRAAAFDVSLHGLERLVPIGAHMEQQQHLPLTLFVSRGVESGPHNNLSILLVL